ncbi:MAG: sensor histidine kinase, partial [Nitrospira sp.]
MIDSSQEALFGAALWEAALEKYACVTHLTVQLFDGNADLVLGPIHSTSIFQVFQDNHYDSGLFAQCARRCLQQTDHRPAVLISQTHGLATVGTSLMLEGTIVGAAVGGYVLSGFSQTLEIQALAREAGIAFTELWGVARKQAPVAQQRLLVYGELLQVLGDALLRENHRTRQYQQGVNALLASEERLRVLTDDLELLVRERTQELLASRDQLRGLSSELNLVEQRERKRMARELHDHLQQMLVLAKLKVGQSKRSSGSPQVSGEMLGQVDQLLTDSLEYTRTLVAELSPPVLHEFGLSAALKWLGEWMLKHNLNVTLQVTDGHDGTHRATSTVAIASDPDAGGDLPPDPASVAPALDPIGATGLAQATEFLYSGPDPIQKGVAPETIESNRAAVLRGRVVDRAGN